MTSKDGGMVFLVFTWKDHNRLESGQRYFYAFRWSNEIETAAMKAAI